MENYIQKFMFEALPMRGAYVKLSSQWRLAIANHKYPHEVISVMGELSVANILLSSSVKLNGKVITELKQNNLVNILVSECSNQSTFRTTAKTSNYINKKIQTGEKITDSGILIISLDSENDGQIYQSIVKLDGSDISQCLNTYMTQSEQLTTIFLLVANEKECIGIMLQELPDTTKQFIQEVNRINILTSSLTKAELETLTLENILYRLFHQDVIKLFDKSPIDFKCSCNNEKVSNMIVGLGIEEANAIINEQGKIEVTCEFCNEVYSYNKSSVESLFKFSQSKLSSKTVN